MILCKTSVFGNIYTDISCQHFTKPLKHLREYINCFELPNH